MNEIQNVQSKIYEIRRQRVIICLTDMARYWEQLHNPNFNPIEFDGFRNSYYS